MSHWRTISRDNVTTLYGLDGESRITDPDDPRNVFSYLICRVFDAKGNVTVYSYVAEDSQGIDRSQAHEANRIDTSRGVQRYLKSIRYGNVQPYFPDWSAEGPEPALPADWHFELVLDYGDHGSDVPVRVEDGGVAYYGDRRVGRADVSCNNGVIHFLD